MLLYTFGHQFILRLNKIETLVKLPYEEIEIENNEEQNCSYILIFDTCINNTYI